MTVSNTGFQNTKNGSSRDIKSGLTYLLIGGGIGATLALLFAPKSGADLRNDLSDLTRKGYDETLELAGRLKDQSADLYTTLKEKTDKVYDFASAKLSRTAELVPEVEDALQNAGELINGEADKAGSRQSSSAGRKSSSIF